MSSSTATTPRAASPEGDAPGSLLLRAGGGGAQGMGHVSRCLALAEAWRAAGGVAGLLVDRSTAERARAMAGGGGIEITAEPVVASAGWLGLDGYRLGPDDTLGVPVGRRLRIDDLGRSGDADCAVVVDQDPAASPAHYAEAPAGASLLLGSRYALLRPRVPADRDPGAAPRRLLALLGGDPTAAVVGVLADALRQITDDAGLAVDVLGGGDLASLAGIADVHVHGFVPDPVPWLDRADLALAAAGTTAWELCRSGIPSVLWATVDNQEPVARAVAAAGAGLQAEATAVSLAAAVRRLVAESELRLALSEGGRHLVDGFGADRVVVALRSREVGLRPAGPEDRDLLLAWVNDPATRAASFATAPVTAEDHAHWFATRLADPDSRLFIAHDRRGPWGLVRFQVVGPAAEVGVSVAPERRGAGRAAPLIRAGLRRLLAERPDLERVEARIRPDNRRSVTAFDRAGFVRTTDEDPVRLIAEAHRGW